MYDKRSRNIIENVRDLCIILLFSILIMLLAAGLIHKVMDGQKEKAKTEIMDMIVYEVKV